MNLWLDLEEWSIKGEEDLIAWLEKEQELVKYTGNVNLVFTGDKGIAKLNESYLDHQGATDVIAFTLDKTEDDEVFRVGGHDSDDECSGEIYVNLERAMSQAREYDVTMDEEIARLAVHGVLHLAGWNDSNEAEKREMTKREDDALARILKRKDRFPWEVVPPKTQD